MSDITITIRHRNETFIHNRAAALEANGFVVSLVTMEPVIRPEDPDVYTFDLFVDFNDAHRLERSDDRWPVANSFFQRAEISENRKGWYAQLASDWTSFGYKTRSLQGALDQEHAAQEARRARHAGLVGRA